jgi:putative phosphoribosyl transferase
MSTLTQCDEPVLIWTGSAMLDGALTVPQHAAGLILIAGLGGTYHHDRVRSVAIAFRQERFAALIADLLTADEQQFDTRTGHFRVDTRFIASRVCDIVEWAKREPATKDLPVALFAGSGVAAACIVASRDLDLFAMSVSAARFETVREHLAGVAIPTLLLFDHAPSFAQSGEIAKSLWATSVITIPGVSSMLDNDLVAEAAAHESGAWFREHAPPLTKVQR